MERDEIWSVTACCCLLFALLVTYEQIYDDDDDDDHDDHDEKVRCSSKIKLRLQTEWVELSEELRVLASCFLCPIRRIQS